MADGPWVLDTSVAVGWFFTDEPLRDQALAVRGNLRDAPHDYVVPPLFHSELVHVLARKSGRDQRFVASALRLVLRLGIRTLVLSEHALLRSTHWACRGLSGYDATFLALAEDVGGQWLTADERAADAAGRRHTETLRAWTPPAR
jgi:predicted nucleic acid-binding protein